MAKRLSKQLSLYDRDSVGKLIPQEVTMEIAVEDIKNYPDLVGTLVTITPMTRGEIKKLFSLSGKVDDVKPETDKDLDGDLILSHCFEPLYTKEEIPFIKPVITRSIVSTIFRESGIKTESGIKKIDEDTDSFGKN